MKHVESEIQKGFVTLFRLQYAAFHRLLFAIPNGGKRGKITAAIMKGEGVMAGAADLMLAIPYGGHHGLFMECKSPGGKQSESQKAFQKEVENQGYRYVIFTSPADGLNLVREYLGQRKC